MSPPVFMLKEALCNPKYTVEDFSNRSWLMIAILHYFGNIHLIYELSSLAITASIMLFYIVKAEA